MNYSSTSANCNGRSYVGTADNRSHFSGGRNKDARPTSRASASYRSGRFVRTRPEAQEWETVHEMFLAARPRFVRMAYAILRSKEDAEDAVQDAFVSAYLHLRTFEGRSAFKTWFTRIVLNAALMIRRKRKPYWMDSVPESGTSDEIPWTERIPASQPDPEMAYAEEETFHLIDVLLRKMSPTLRQAFTMTYYDEMSSRQAGAVLGITAGTFKSRLFRARRHLMNHAQRYLAPPIRSGTRSPIFTGKNNSQALGARPAEISFSEIAFS